MDESEVRDDKVEETDEVEEMEETEVSEQAEGEDTEYGVDDTAAGEGESTGTVCGDESEGVSSVMSKSVASGKGPNNSRCSGVR